MEVRAKRAAEKVQVPKNDLDNPDADPWEEEYDQPEQAQSCHPTAHDGDAELAMRLQQQEYEERPDAAVSACRSYGGSSGSGLTATERHSIEIPVAKA